MSIYKDLIEVVKTTDKTPREIENILNNTQRSIGSKSIPKMIEELNKKGIKAGKTKGRYEGNAIEIEGQFFEYEGANKGWIWRSGAANQNFLGSQPKNQPFWNKRRGDPGKVDTSKLPTHEEYKEKVAGRRNYNFDPLEEAGFKGGNSGIEDLKRKKWNVEYHTNALENAKAKYEKALADYKKDYEYHSKQLAKAIGEKDQFMIEFRKKFGEALRK